MPKPPTTTIAAYQCQRCGHAWVPRNKSQQPRTCPACKSPYWTTPPRHKKEA